MIDQENLLAFCAHRLYDARRHLLPTVTEPRRYPLRSLIDRTERVPRTCVWELTNACNLRCLHCEGSAGKRRRHELSTAEALALCDELAALGCRTCNLSGGEPLLRRDWPMIARRLVENGIAVHLVSNGTLVDTDVVQRAQDAGVSAFAFSIDGLAETHNRVRVSPSRRYRDGFALVMRAAERVAASPLKLGFITHISLWNLGELDALYEQLASVRPDVWQLQLALPAGRLRDIDEPYLIAPVQLLDVYAALVRFMRDGRVPVRVTDTIGYYTPLEPLVRAREFEDSVAFWTGCYAGCLVVGIESDGNVVGCPSMPRDFVAGNLRERSLTEIWRDEERFSYNTRWDDENVVGACASCPYRRLCRCGCTSLAYDVTGTIYTNPYCLHRVVEAQGQGVLDALLAPPPAAGSNREVP